MPAYIQLADVKELVPSADPDDTTGDDILQDVIDALMDSLDEFTGQYLANGYTGIYTLRRFDIKRNGTRLCVPRMFSLDSVETRRSTISGWEMLDSDGYEAGSVYPQKYGTGIDTIDVASPIVGDVRVRGSVGWGFPTDDESDPLAADPVPRVIKQEAKRQARYNFSRQPLGGSRGTSIHSGDMEMDKMDTFEFLISTRRAASRLIDKRRLTGG